MRHIRGFLFSFVLTGVFASSAFAGTVQMHFESVGGGSIGGVYVYPYNFSINGSSGLSSLICDTYDREITIGESWEANEHLLLAAGGLFNNLTDYEAAAIIFNEILTNQVDAADGNLAIWGLFSNNAKGNSGWSAYVQSLETAALASTGTYSSAFYNHFVLYTPLPGSKGMAAQEFMGYNPTLAEPASLASLAMGVVMLMGWLRLRKGATNAT
ncbi:MAG TPA: hypothetical protein VND65_16650 [Candidatus Binatia bacterium]|nr:hypothetical protein [Candidatus Binatia bacterium]